MNVHLFPKWSFFVVEIIGLMIICRAFGSKSPIDPNIFQFCADISAKIY